jgi:hypothetical protein
MSATPESPPAAQTGADLYAMLSQWGWSKVQPVHLFQLPERRVQAVSLGHLRHMELDAGSDWYFHVCPSGWTPDRDSGRPTAGDATRVAAFWIDIDDKRFGGDQSKALGVVREISSVIGADPTDTVRSGGGFHPYWALEEPIEVDDENRAEVSALLKRWHAFAVRIVGTEIDNTNDLARVLRVPGTINRKYGLPAERVSRGGAPVPLQTLIDAMDACDIPQTPVSAGGEAEPRGGECEAALLRWQTPGEPCPAVTRELSGWRTARDADLHGTTRDSVGRLLRLGEQGHAGVGEAMVTARDEFISHAEAGGSSGHRRSVHEATREWQAFLNERFVAGLIATPTPEADRGCCGGQAAELGVISDDIDDIWDSRPWMRAIHDVAKSRMVAPMALLAAFLGRVAAEVPEWVVLPGIAGPRASLNLYVALVGPPGAGKSAAIGVSREMATMVSHLAGGWTSHQGKPGSGEGLMRMFADPVREEDPETGHKTWRLSWNSHRVVMTAEEVGVIESLQDRAGSTLAPILREMWGGVGTGFGYADPSKRVSLGDHEYRLVLLVGAQPGRVDFITSEADAGTPQRYLWIDAEDREMDSRVPHMDIPEAVVVLPLEFGRPHAGLVEVVVEEWLWWLIRDRRAAQGRGEDWAPGQHEDLNRLVVAALIAFCESRMTISKDDWRLAGIILAHSLRTFKKLLDHQRREREQTNILRGHSDAERSEAATEHRLLKQALNVARVVHRHAANPPAGKRPHSEHCATTCLRGAVRVPSGENREDFAKAAIALTVERGWVKELFANSGEAIPRRRRYFAPGARP